MRKPFFVFTFLISFVCGAFAQDGDMEPGTVFTDCEGCPEMVVVPAGTFLMGTPQGEFGGDRYERPVHEVVIGYDFAVGQFEIKVAVFRRFLNDTGYVPRANCNNRRIFHNGRFIGERWKQNNWHLTDDPADDANSISCVSWHDAQVFLDWLSGLSGYPYRLLSESEWEYAARAGTSTRYPWGDSAIDRTTIRTGEAGGEPISQSFPHSQFPPNSFGLFDMNGGVWEWVQDCEHDNYLGAPTDGSTWEADRCQERVLRGGTSGRGHPREMRSANRSFSAAIESDYNLGFGFRIARDLITEEEGPGAE